MQVNLLCPPIAAPVAKPAMAHALRMAPSFGRRYGQDKEKHFWKTFAAAIGIGLASLGIWQAAKPSVPPPPPSAVVQTGQPVDLNVQSGWSTDTLNGRYANKQVNVELGSNWLDGRTIRGSVNGGPVNLKVISHWTKYTVEGTYHNRPVNLDIKSGFLDQTITGTFAGTAVNINIHSGWGGRTITGTLNGKAVNLKSESNGFFSRKISGTIDGHPIELNSRTRWGGVTVNGGSDAQNGPYDDFLINLLIFNNISYTTSSGDTTTSTPLVGL